MLERLKVGVPFLAMFGYVNCSPTPFEAMHTSVNRAGFFKAPTFLTIMSEYGSTGTPSDPTVSLDQHKVTIDAEQVAQCEAGEWDMMDAAITCKVNANLLLTIKDQASEKVALKFPLNGTLDTNALANQLLPTIQALVFGSNSHVFLCIDANNNDICADEHIVDLNTISAQIIAAGFWPTVPMVPARLEQTGVCGVLRAGVVFFHNNHNFTAADQTYTVATADTATTNVVKDILKNLDSQSQTTTTSAGTVVNFPIRLGKAQRSFCPFPNVRTNGCFAKGTNINVTKEFAVPIETLHVGSPVYMADGRTIKISRVIAGPEAKPMITFEMGAGDRITVTTEHPLLTNKGLRLAKEIRMGEELFDANGNAVTILGIRHSSYSDLVYNFEFEGTRENDHLILAEKIVSGDLYLQNKLSADEKGAAPGLLSAK